MLNSKLIRSALSLILVLVLVFSLGAVNAFADEASETGVETEVVTDGATAAESETAAGDGHDHDHDHDEEKEEKKGCGGAINSAYAVLALVGVLGFAFVAKKREEN